jgi:hypothetical protein
MSPNPLTSRCEEVMRGPVEKISILFFLFFLKLGKTN